MREGGGGTQTRARGDGSIDFHSLIFFGINSRVCTLS